MFDSQVEDFVFFVDKLVWMWFQVEVDVVVVSGYWFIVYELIVVLQSWGQVVVYYGYDDVYDYGCWQFGYVGFVILCSVINFYMFSGQFSEYELVEVLDEMFLCIVFDWILLMFCV